MKFLKSFIKVGIGSNLVIFLVFMLLPAFLVTDHVDVFYRVISSISEK